MTADLAFFVKGFTIGFAIAAPVGPIGVLCIRRTLQYGMKSGLATGAGAAVADATYGAIAAFGLTAISNLLQQIATPLQLLGGAFLLYLGFKTLMQKPVADAGDSGAKTAHSWRETAQDFTSTVFLTLSNPATILSFVAIFTTLGIVQGAPDYALSALMVLGVFLGSLMWWCILSGGISIVRHKMDEHMMRLANIVSGIIIGGFGLFAVWHFLYIKLN